MQLLAYDIGLTDLAKNRSGRDSELLATDLDTESLKRKVAENKPANVAFNGKRAAQATLNKERVRFGRQTETIAGAAAYVLPSTSKSAKDHWDARHWQDFAQEVKRIRKNL